MARRCLVISALPGPGSKSPEEMRDRIVANAPKSLDLEWHELRFRETGSEEGEEEGGIGLLASCSLDESALQMAGGEDRVVETLKSAAGEGCISLAEVWLTAPARVPIERITLDSITVSKPFGDCAKRMMAQHGIMCIAGAVSEEQLDQLREVSSARVAEAEAALAQKHPDISVGETLFAFKELSSRGSQRFDLLFPVRDQYLDPEGGSVEENGRDRCVGGRGRDGSGVGVVDQLASEGCWVPLVNELIGEEGVCNASLVYSRPGADAQEWHTDGAFLGDRAEWGADICSKPYALCIFLALQDLTPQLGFTQFWPGSHRGEGLAGFGDASLVLGAALDGMLKAGDCVIYDYRLMHRGMPNVSKGTQRDIMQFVYHASWYTERKNYGTESLLS